LKEEISEDVWIPTACYACFNGCSLRVHRVNGVVVEIEGNPESPNNLGRVCAKTHAAIMELYSPYRVKVPLKRTNPEKGIGVDPKWVEIGWDEALDTTAKKLKEIKEEDPRQFIYQDMDYQGLVVDIPWLFFAFGSPNWVLSGGGIHCGGGTHTAAELFNASFVQLPDVAHCKYILQIGSGLGFGSSYGTAVLATQEYADARVERGMKIVSLEPWLSVPAAKANEWIPIRPGTDLAFCLAMLNVLLNDLEIYDAEFLKKYTNGPYLVEKDGYFFRDDKEGKPLIWDPEDETAKSFDDKNVKDFALLGIYKINNKEYKPAFQVLKEHVKQYTPQWASKITTVPAETIRRIAKEFGEAASIGSKIKIDGKELPLRPAAIEYFKGAQGHKNSWWFCMTADIICAVVGATGVPGGRIGFAPDMAPAPDGSLQRGPAHQLPTGYPPKLEELERVYESGHINKIDLGDLFPAGFDNCHLAYVGILEKEKYKIPYTIKAMLIEHSNPVHSSGNKEIVAEALKKIPFIASIALFIDETTEFADIVLPESHFLERYDFLVNNRCAWAAWIGKYHFIETLRQPVIKPLYNTKSGWEILIELADRAGFLYGAPKTPQEKWVNHMPPPGDGGYNWWLNYLYIGDPENQLELNKKYKVEEIIDRIGKSMSKCDLSRSISAFVHPEWKGSDEFAHGIEWYKEHSFITKKATPEEIYPLTFKGFRVPIYFEFLKKTGEKLKMTTEKLGIPWDTSSYVNLPTWFPNPAESSPSDYDMYIISYKTAYTTHGSSAFNVLLMEEMKRDPYFTKMIINYETAKRKGFKNNDEVWLESVEGCRIKGRLKLSEGIHPEVLATGSTLGHWSDIPHANGTGAFINELIPISVKDTDPVSGNMDLARRVKIYKA